MVASAKSLSTEDSSPTDDWTVVQPRRGKRNTAVHKFAIPKREKEVQLWAPIDLETSPDRESKLLQKMQISIEKLANSEFHRTFFDQIQNSLLDKFHKVLGSEKKMPMVIYGIGSIESFESPRMQLSLAILIKRCFDWVGEIEVFDPIISLTESKVLTSLGCSVLSVNEQGRRHALKPTLFFMPHCEVDLYDNLLEANWEVGKLNRVIVFGNSFGAYEQHASLCKSSAVAYSRKRVFGVRSFTEEFGINVISDDYFRAFCGLSWHFISPPTEAHLPSIDNGSSCEGYGRWLESIHAILKRARPCMLVWKKRESCYCAKLKSRITYGVVSRIISVASSITLSYHVFSFLFGGKPPGAFLLELDS